MCCKNPVGAKETKNWQTRRKICFGVTLGTGWCMLAVKQDYNANLLENKSECNSSSIPAQQVEELENSCGMKEKIHKAFFKHKIIDKPEYSDNFCDIYVIPRQRKEKWDLLWIYFHLMLIHDRGAWRACGHPGSTTTGEGSQPFTPDTQGRGNTNTSKEWGNCSVISARFKYIHT